MKKSPLNRKGKRLRKHTLRPIETLKKDADKAIQDYYRDIYEGKLCEAECGRVFQVMHHPIPKSLSARLRYTTHEENLVFLCNPCHFAHHRKGDPKVHATMIKNRGQEWYDNLERLRREYLDINNRKFLEEIIAKYGT